MLGLDLTLSYNGATVVHGAELHLEPGRVTALVGPNGSGKSTLLADTLGRTVIAPGQLPAGLLTAVVGAPYFV